MKVLIIGDGGREWAIAQNISEHIGRNNTYVLTKKSIFSKIATLFNVDYANYRDLALFAKYENFDLTIVGPENFLEAGIVDSFEAEGLNIFGPNAKAAQIESSKEFAKKYLAKANINTAKHESFSDFQTAMNYLQKQSFPVVIKDDSLCAGKGVSIACDINAAKEVISELTKINHSFIIEEFLTGKEFSHFAMVWKGQVVQLGVARDFKRLRDNDDGNNTGGMGVLYPVDYVNQQDLDFVNEQVVKPFLNALKCDKIDYCGFLYTGLIKDAGGKISVIEFNARMGDPETEVLMQKYESNMAADILLLQKGELKNIKLNDKPAIGVVVANENYTTGAMAKVKIPSLDNIKHIPMGLDIENDQLVSTGGRIFIAINSHADINVARKELYDALNKLDLKNVTYRKDI